MAMYPIYCSEPGHETRSLFPGWCSVLGEADQPNLKGFVCEACTPVLRAREAGQRADLEAAQLAELKRKLGIR